MTIYTTGFTKKTAEQFFEPIRYRMIQMLLDVRLKNTSQMCGFTRKRDLPYLLGLIGCKYEHCPSFAPSEEILADWKKKRITWQEYEERYRTLIIERGAVKEFITCFEGVHDSVCLLCSEVTPEHCHRRLFAEMIAESMPDTEIIHL
ncbi:MAG: DUF488 domain-containing protein [Synergistaceae bacterium]|nr:DUF488 domain-containing protein [Synergistaceae bacterium]